MFSPRSSAGGDSFHVIHKVPVGDSPYVKAKHVQLVEKDPERAISLFWAAINAGDRVDSALKDMAIVMKQQNRPEEAIEAIKSLRDRCTDQAQEALDNVLLDLFKRCGRLDDQISLLKQKLHLIHQGLAFNGKRTKTARSQGKKFQVSIEQEASRLLGNLGWAFMQQSNYVAAEAVYRKALSIQPDSNKLCNLGICLMKQGKLQESKTTLESVPLPDQDPWCPSNSHYKAYERAQEKLCELGALQCVGSTSKNHDLLNSWNPMCSQILAATSGFGPLKQSSRMSDESENFLRRKKRSQDTSGDEQSFWSEELKLPLTSDWTNKTCKSGDLTPVKSRVWKNLLDENVPVAKRVLKPEFDESEFKVLNQENQIVSDVIDHVIEQESVQRRLKVFEEITTLPALN